jgi:hypothetical protein
MYARKQQTCVDTGQGVRRKNPQALGNRMTALQRAIGNRAVNRVLRSQYEVSRPGDPDEVEAERAADEVMRMPEPAVQRKCRQCEDEERSERYQRKPAGDGAVPGGGSPPLVSGSGQQLSRQARAFFEPRFGMDLGDVRIHTGEEAAASARAFDARAFTYGRNIVFGRGQYQPETTQGKRLLAHELAHVAQSAGGAIHRAPAEGVDEDGEAMGIGTSSINDSQLEEFGRDAVQTVGYDELIRKAQEEGLAPESPPAGSGTGQRIQRQDGATFGEIFGGFATAAGIVSQVDSPLPGPADLVALGILAVGLVAAGAIVLSQPRTQACPPCPPNPAPEIDRVPPSTPHWPCTGDHWHYRVYNQNPVTCECFLSGRLFGGCCGDPGAPC